MLHNFRSTRLAPMRLLLALLLPGCSSVSPLPPVVVQPPLIPPLPAQAMQPVPPVICATRCSLGLSTLLDSLANTPTAPTSQDSPASAPIKP